MHRVDDLADREKGKKEDHIPFKSIVPLKEIISEVVQKGKKTKTVAIQYDNLINHLDNEFHILLDANIDDIKKYSLPEIGEAVDLVRKGKVNPIAGYDGEFGEIKVFDKHPNKVDQKTLI